jgi:hypothetical protein
MRKDALLFNGGGVMCMVGAGINNSAWRRLHGGLSLIRCHEVFRLCMAPKFIGTAATLGLGPCCNTDRSKRVRVTPHDT